MQVQISCRMQKMKNEYFWLFKGLIHNNIYFTNQASLMLTGSGYSHQHNNEPLSQPFTNLSHYSHASPADC